jgi:uncharacterized protein YaiI (UPF0178 family)
MNDETHRERRGGQEQKKPDLRSLTIWVDADSIPKDIRPLLIRRALERREYGGIMVCVQFVAARADRKSVV